MTPRRDAYITHIKETVGDDIASYQRKTSLIKKLSSFEEEIGRPIEEGFTSEDYIRFYHYLRVRSHRTFALYKSTLRSYLEFIHQDADDIEQLENVTFADIHQSKAEPVYIKNVAALRSYIDLLLQTKDVPDITVYDPVVSALFLSWYGFTAKEITEVLREDVEDHGVRAHGRLVEMEPFAMEVLQRLKYSTGFYSGGDLFRFRRLAESRYLLRTNRSSAITVASLRVMASGLIRDTEFGILTLSNAFTSGAFFRLYMYEHMENGRIEDISNERLSAMLGVKISGKSARSAKLMEYRYYKKLYE